VLVTASIPSRVRREGTTFAVSNDYVWGLTKLLPGNSVIPASR
jgi:hypothetical protein